METVNHPIIQNLISLPSAPVKAEVQSPALWLNRLSKQAFYRPGPGLQASPCPPIYKIAKNDGYSSKKGPANITREL